MNSNSRPAGLLLAGMFAALLTAAAFYFGTGLRPHWWLTWLAPVPTLIYSYRTSAKSTWLVAFAGFFLGALNLWHFYQVLELPIPVRILGFAVPALIFAWSVSLSRAFFLRESFWLAALPLPLLRVSAEYLFSLGKDGTALNLAYSQMDFLPVLQIASIVGIWGITFTVLCFSSILAIVISRPRQSLSFALPSLAIVIAIIAFGIVRLRVQPRGEHVTIGFAATDRRPLLADDESQTAGIIGAYSDAIAQLAAERAQFVIIPEKIGPIQSQSAGPNLASLSAAAAKNHVMLVAGLDHRDRPLRHNLAFLFGMDGRIERVYEKHFMVPHWEDGYERGTSIVMLPEPHTNWGLLICKDMDFPSLSRQYGKTGADLLFVPAWDFVVDDWLHDRMAVLRGVESGFAIARSAKQGLMTLSDNRGRVIAQAHSSEGMGTLVAEIRLSHDRTLYTRLGDCFAWLILVSAAALIVRCAIIRGTQQTVVKTAGNACA